MPSDSVPPPFDLDVVAARDAEAHYRGLMANGAPEARAWAEAVEVFRLHHPAWPLPLAEREAVRVVGGMLAWRRVLDTKVNRSNHRAPPLHLLRRLARPDGAPKGAPDRVEEDAQPAAAPHCIAGS
ncbi:hypothetical protein [Falsiroseomonas sp. HW251]|uniref:hypothetical protein n=1 Tax=Falsiroseomonas sp. HW251 TaxID=3390998 RepID=UPI003D31C8AE